MSESQNVKWDSFAILFDITGYLSVCEKVLFEICVGPYRVAPALHLNMMDFYMKVDPINIAYVS